MQEVFADGYDGSSYYWQAPSNHKFLGPTSLIFESNAFAHDLTYCRFTLKQDHFVHTRDGVSCALWSIPKLFIEHCSQPGNSEASFWLWLVPAAKSRDLFLKSAKLNEMMEPYRSEVVLRKRARLEEIAWEGAESMKATHFQALSKLYNWAQGEQKTAKTTDKSTTSDTGWQIPEDLEGLLDEPTKGPTSSH